MKSAIYLDAAKEDRPPTIAQFCFVLSQCKRRSSILSSSRLLVMGGGPSEIDKIESGVCILEDDFLRVS